MSKYPQMRVVFVSLKPLFTAKEVDSVEPLAVASLFWSRVPMAISISYIDEPLRSVTKRHSHSLDRLLIIHSTGHPKL